MTKTKTMEEPSILDYLKAKLTPWRGPAPRIPDGEARTQTVATSEARTALPPTPVEQVVDSGLAPDLPSRAAEAAGALESPLTIAWPWRSLAALLLALLAQRALGPPEQGASTGVTLYLLAAALLVWAFVRGEWVLPALPAAKASADEEAVTVRLAHLLVALPLAVLAFITFADNLITGLGFVVWVLAIGNLMWAFWISREQAQPLWSRLRAALIRPSWQIAITPTTLLLLAGVVLVVFFRFYRLGDVPPEMTSDHAEKLLDVADVLRGETHIFFPRNAGREAFQMYLDAAIAALLGTGLTFTTLKLGTALVGMASVPLVYLVGKEVGSRNAGLWAALLVGIGYWPNVISRVGLRFPFYPFFTALVLWLLLRAFRSGSRNLFLLAGLALGFSAYGYTADRILPLVVLAAFGLFIVHRQAAGRRQQAFWWLALLVLMALAAFLPLLRYIVDEPQMFAYRSLTRVSGVEQPLPGPAWQILLSNMWNALTMFTRSGGNVWLASIPFYPALGVVSGALAHLGALLVLGRYLRRRNWQDLFLLLSVPLLLLPSALALAFPIENPNLYRTGGALVLVFVFAGLALDGLFDGLKSGLGPRRGAAAAWGLGLFLLAWSLTQNYDWVFNRYYRQYQLSAWNTSEIGHVIRGFADSMGDLDSAWVVPNPHWVDTRLVGINAGYPQKDYALWPEDLPKSLEVRGPKLFIVRPSDQPTVDLLNELYPGGNWQRYPSAVNQDKDFLMYYVLP